MKTLSELGRAISEVSGRRQAYLTMAKEGKAKLKRLESRRDHIAKASNIIRTIAEATQRKLQYQISELSTMAEGVIFNDPYEVKFEFVQKRGQTEAERYFVKNGNLIEPMEATGHGPVDIASFASRISLWMLARERTRNTFILDEPFKNLNGSQYQEATWKLVKMLSERLRIQFIIVTQIDGLTEQADKAFRVVQENGVSRVIDLAKPKLKLTLRH
jgi:hypothetical protein